MASMDRQREFLILFLKTQDDVRAFIGSMVRDPQAREDLFQEVALILWQKFDDYDTQRPFGAWARGIAANKMMQYGEKAKRESVLFTPEVLQSVLNATNAMETTISHERDALRGCMERLRGNARRLIALRYGESMKLGDIARQEGSTLDAVHKALSRIRFTLQKCVSRKLGIPAEEV